MIMNPEISYYENGQIKQEIWCDKKHKLHRLDQPAFRLWNQDGVLIKEEWYKDDKLHRINGAAFKQWYENGNLKYEEWFQDNKCHRLDGPAYQEWDQKRELILELWKINGVDKTKEINKFIEKYPLPENEVLFKLTFG